MVKSTDNKLPDPSFFDLLKNEKKFKYLFPSFILLFILFSLIIGYSLNINKSLRTIRNYALTTNVHTPAPSPACYRLRPENVSPNDINITKSMWDKCAAACPGATLYANRYTCSEINLPAGCQDNGVRIDVPYPNGTIPIGNLNCGSVQIDVGCKNNLGSWGSVVFSFKSESVPCGPPQVSLTPPERQTPTPPITITPTPPRKSLCVFASTSRSIMSTGQSTILSSQPTDPVREYWYAFYNLDNLYGPNNPKPVCVTTGGDVIISGTQCPTGTHHLIYRANAISSNLIGTRNLTYPQVFVVDKNLKNDGTPYNQVPPKVSFTGYFLDLNGNLSLPDAKCIARITRVTITVTPTPPKITRTITPTPPKITRTRTPTPPKITRTPTPPPPPVGCANYGIDEHSGEELSNIIKIIVSPSKDVSLVNTLYCSSDGICDAEAMDNKGSTVYLVGNKNSPALYTVNKTKDGRPKVFKIANLNRKYEGLSFRPGDASSLVWGGSRDGNIYKLNLSGTTIKNYGPAGGTIKTITWNNNGSKLFVSTGNKLLSFTYDPTSDTLTKDNNFNASLPGGTDGMDMTTDGYIVGGYKSGGDLIMYFCKPDIANNTCPVATRQRVPLASYNSTLLTTQNTPYNNLDAFTWLCGSKP